MSAIPRSASANHTDEVIERVRPRFLARLREHQLALLKIRGDIRKQGATAERLDELRRIGHQLYGTAETFGYHDISAAAAALKDAAAQSEVTALKHVSNLLDAFRRVQRPDSTPHEAACSERPSAPASSLVADASILVVEDQPHTQLIIKGLLADVASVECTDTVSEAMRLIGERAPDLILLDNSLAQNECGFDLLERLQRDGLAIPVFMLTASDEPEAITRAIVAGATDYILKPIDPFAFKSKIREFVISRRLQVLIADDDPTVRELLSHKFRARGVRTAEADSGDQALLLLGQIKPSLVVLDRMMPGGDGVTVLRHMRDDPSLRTIPVLILSARRNESDILEGFRGGAADYVVKPFNADIVIERGMRLMARDAAAAAQ